MYLEVFSNFQKKCENQKPDGQVLSQKFFVKRQDKSSLNRQKIIAFDCVFPEGLSHFALSVSGHLSGVIFPKLSLQTFLSLTLANHNMRRKSFSSQLPLTSFKAFKQVPASKSYRILNELSPTVIIVFLMMVIIITEIALTQNLNALLFCESCTYFLI